MLLTSSHLFRDIIGLLNEQLVVIGLRAEGVLLLAAVRWMYAVDLLLLCVLATLEIVIVRVLLFVLAVDDVFALMFSNFF